MATHPEPDVLSSTVSKIKSGNLSQVRITWLQFMRAVWHVNHSQAAQKQTLSLPGPSYPIYTNPIFIIHLLAIYTDQINLPSHTYLGGQGGFQKNQILPQWSAQAEWRTWLTGAVRQQLYQLHHCAIHSCSFVKLAPFIRNYLVLLMMCPS